MKEWENRMPEVAALFGVQMGQEFQLSVAGESIQYKCRFNDQGMYIFDEYWNEWEYDHDHLIMDLLTGSACIDWIEVQNKH